jgi:hypothetical protein
MVEKITKSMEEEMSPSESLGLDLLVSFLSYFIVFYIFQYSLFSSKGYPPLIDCLNSAFPMFICLKLINELVAESILCHLVNILFNPSIPIEISRGKIPPKWGRIHQWTG